MSKKLFSDLQKKVIRERYESGESTVSLAAEFGGSVTTIWKAIRQVGGKIRGPKEAYKTRKIVERFKKCLRCKEIVPFSLFHRHLSGEISDTTCKACFLKRKLRMEEDKKTQSARRKEYAKKRTSKIKREFFDAYGGKCECCGESRCNFLSIDHVHGGGRKHSKLAGGQLGVIRELKRDGWPKDKYRILCFNCNCGRRPYTECPHKFDQGKGIYAKEITSQPARWARAKREQLKPKIINGYGGKCYCCGESRHEFLTIDHIKNNGAEERKNGKVTLVLYMEIIEFSFPDKYRIACYNCNMGRRHGDCPHNKYVCC